MDPAMRSAFGLNNKADDKTIQKQLILKRLLIGSQKHINFVIN